MGQSKQKGLPKNTVNLELLTSTSFPILNTIPFSSHCPTSSFSNLHPGRAFNSYSDVLWKLSNCFCTGRPAIRFVLPPSYHSYLQTPNRTETEEVRISWFSLGAVTFAFTLSKLLKHRAQIKGSARHDLRPTKRRLRFYRIPCPLTSRLSRFNKPKAPKHPFYHSSIALKYL